jgi:hypothetical protein
MMLRDERCQEAERIVNRALCDEWRQNVPFADVRP